MDSIAVLLDGSGIGLGCAHVTNELQLSVVRTFLGGGRVRSCQQRGRGGSCNAFVNSCLFDVVSDCCKRAS